LNNFCAQSAYDEHAGGSTIAGVTATGGIESGAAVGGATVVGAIEPPPGVMGRTVTEGTTVVGVDGARGAVVVAGVMLLDEAVTTVDDSDVGVGSSAIAVLEDSLSTSTALVDELSADVELVESPDRVRLHTTIAIPRMKTMIETGVSHFRAIAGPYHVPRHAGSSRPQVAGSSRTLAHLGFSVRQLVRQPGDLRSGDRIHRFMVEIPFEASRLGEP
jgi:hypothetical protein